MKTLFFNRALRILLSTNRMILMVGVMLVPIYALFAEKVRGNLMDASITGGIFALAARLTSLISSKKADRSYFKVQGIRIFLATDNRGAVSLLCLVH